MTKPDSDRSEDNDDMQQAISLREHRRDRFREEGERPLWQNLSMIGALGWLIVTPIVIGALLGSWLDRELGTGITFSGALIFVGTVVGSYLAWQRIRRG